MRNIYNLIPILMSGQCEKFDGIVDSLSCVDAELQLIFYGESSGRSTLFEKCDIN